MRILKSLLVLGLFVALLGLYLEWFSLSSRGRDAESNKVNFNLAVDLDKMKEDAEKAKEKTTELTDKAAAEVEALGDQPNNVVK